MLRLSATRRSKSVRGIRVVTCASAMSSALVAARKLLVGGDCSQRPCCGPARVISYGRRQSNDMLLPSGVVSQRPTQLSARRACRHARPLGPPSEVERARVGERATQDLFSSIRCAESSAFEHWPSESSFHERHLFGWQMLGRSIGAASAKFGLFKGSPRQRDGP